MRRLDDTPLDPEIEACLDAIDATLAGEPVDPRFAEMAELALLLADERPRPREAFGRELDARVARRFGPEPSGAGGALGSAHPPRRAWWRPSWATLGAGGAVAALAGAIIAVVIVAGGSNSGGGAVAGASSTASSASSASATAAASSGSSGASKEVPSSAHAPETLDRSSSGAQLSLTPGKNLQGLTPAARALQLPSNGRKVIQSAELDLSTAPNRIEFVAQEVFNVVGQYNGIVDRSSVTQTGGPDGSAQFQLRLPSATMAQTLGKLSALAGAQVISRTDSSRDVNQQWVSAGRALADAQALRSALLKQLANAVTTAQIDSLQARIRDVEATIGADQAALRALNSQIAYSQVMVNIYARPTVAPVRHHHSSGGFGLGKATHVAGRVLVVAAGVALIALAVLVPLGLVAAVLAWLGLVLRRRRREQALDLA